LRITQALATPGTNGSSPPSGSGPGKEASLIREPHTEFVSLTSTTTSTSTTTPASTPPVGGRSQKPKRCKPRDKRKRCKPNKPHRHGHKPAHHKPHGHKPHKPHGHKPHKPHGHKPAGKPGAGSHKPSSPHGGGPGKPPSSHGKPTSSHRKPTGSHGAQTPDQPILEASSTRREVLVELDAAEQTSVKIGDKALITLPDNQTTPGVVSRIGRVATSSSGNGQGSGSSPPTIQLYIALEHPRAAHTLDQATVQVQITTATVEHALAVPVIALRALASGGYAVSTEDAAHVQHLVPVTAGLFDDANGLVQVKGNLAAGDQVVVP
jgi:hypothetical protein